MDKSGCKKIIAHLLGTKEDGSDVIGVYPLLSNGTYRFIVFDFDNHEKGAEVTDFANTDNEWHKEVDALRKMCELNGIRPLVERSRSGKGVHVWIFFKKAIPAATARNFGFLLLDKGSTSINLKSFHYYDRMYPSQDVAKVLYGILLDRKCLSDSNGDAWRDEYGITYIIFTIEEIMNLMNLGNKKVNKMLIELEPHGLIYRRHQGLGKPNKCIMKTQKKMQHLNDVPMLSLT